VRSEQALEKDIQAGARWRQGYLGEVDSKPTEKRREEKRREEDQLILRNYAQSVTLLSPSLLILPLHLTVAASLVLRFV
jgi:hypothetical protein